MKNVITCQIAIFCLVSVSFLLSSCAGGSDIGLVGDIDLDSSVSEAGDETPDATDGDSEAVDIAEVEEDGDFSDGDMIEEDSADGDSDGVEEDAVDVDEVEFDETEIDIEIPEDYAFIPDAAMPEAGQIVLSNPTIEEDYLIIEVQANGIDDLLGLAFRLQYDSSILSLAEVERGNALTDGALLRAASVGQGEAWVGITNPRGITVDVTEARVVCQIAFKVIGLGMTRIEFDSNPWHSLAADERIRSIDVTWFGGVFGPGEER